MDTKIYIYLNNSEWLLRKEYDTIEIIDKEYAENYVKEFNQKHGWKYDGVDYLEAVIY